MSSRAITSDTIRAMYAYNQAEGRSEIEEYHGSISRAEKGWATPRKRLLVHAVATIAFVCLMCIDEVLNLRFEDVEATDNHISITLETRKIHQYGGKLNSFQSPCISYMMLYRYQTVFSLGIS